MLGSTAGLSIPRGAFSWSRGAFVVCLFPLAAALANPVWRLGLPAAWDEVELHGLLQAAREGLELPLGLAHSTLYTRWLAAFLTLPGAGPAFLRVPVLLGLALEVCLLWRLARRLGGEQAAFFAVAVHALSRLTWLRLGSTLGFSLGPLFVLLAWNLLREAQGRAAGLAAGFAAACLIGEYEGLLFCLPALAWLLWERRRENAGTLLLGMVLGLGLLLWLLPEGSLDHYLTVRGASLRKADLPWWREGVLNLAGFFGLGSKPLQDFGPGSAFAPAGLVLALLGLRRLPVEARWMLAGGLLPLFAPAPGAVEAHRAAVAWPALCLAAGLGAGAGLERAREHGASGIAAAALIGLLLGGAGFQALSTYAWRRAAEPSQYGYAWRLERVARFVRAQGGTCLSELNFRSMGAFRLRLGRFRPKPGALPWVLLSGEQVGRRPPRWGAWHPFAQGDGGTLWLLRPDDPTLWTVRERRLRAWLAELQKRPWTWQLEWMGARLQQGVEDPFLRARLVDRILWAAKDVGLSADLAGWLAARPDLEARQCLALAGVFEAEQPGRALALVERALRLDPENAGARRYRQELRARQR